MPNPNKNGAILRGIVVAGDSRQDVEENYRAVATGLSVKVLQGPNNSFTILSNSDADITLLNPETGAMDLQADNTLLAGMEFLSSDSDEKVTAFYSLCSEGCSSHIIADDPELIKFCPVCASELKDLNEDEINEMIASGSDEDETEETDSNIVAIATSFEEAKEIFASITSNSESEMYAAKCDGTEVVTNYGPSKFKYSPFSAKAASIALVETDFKVESNSSGDSFPANHYICADSEGCGSHVISSSDSPVFCPVCASGLIEPEEENKMQRHVVSVSNSASGARKAFADIVKQEGTINGYASDDSTFATNARKRDFSFSPLDGESVSACNIAEDAVFTVTASTRREDEVVAHYYVCAASDHCGAHIVSSVSDVEFCPVCASGVVEPDDVLSDEELESMDEDDIDLAEDDTDLDEDDTIDEEIDVDEEYDPLLDEEVEEEVIASSEEDDDEDYEEDLDEEDDDDEDYDEDLDDEVEEDDDGKNSLSVSSVRIKGKKGRISRKLPVTVDCSLLSIASEYKDLDADSLEVSCAGTIQKETTWLAFYNGMPVAKATASTAAKHSEIFNKPLFGNAVIASAKETSVKEALSSFGFVEIKPEFNVEAHVTEEIRSQVESKVSDVVEKYEAEAKDYNDRMQSALATAAQGLNRNFFRGVSNPNPIKTALMSTLAAAGIREPEAILSKAFSDHSDSYHKNLISQASLIVSKSVEVQNELAEAVSSSNPGTVAVSNAESIVKVGTPAKAPISNNTARVESVSSGDVFGSMDSILSQLGKRR